MTAVIAVLSACTSGPRATSSAPQSSSNVVDGIPIPPSYVAPTPTIVAAPASCPTSFARTLADLSGGAHVTVTSQRGSHLITCRYHLKAAGRSARDSCTGARILVNTESLAYTAFSRWEVETGQNSMWSGKPALLPRPVSGVGTQADWVPALLELGAGDTTTWVSVFLTCPHEAPVRARAEQVAKRLAVEGLASTA
jgi:hypothetical protein